MEVGNRKSQLVEVVKYKIGLMIIGYERIEEEIRNRIRKVLRVIGALCELVWKRKELNSRTN